MATYIVVRNPKDWPIKIPNVEIVSAKDYLTETRFAKMNRAHIYNLCRSYSYQSTGYYVSLLAEGRQHRPLPSISTLQDMRSKTICRIITQDLDDLIQKKLKDIQSKEFVLSIYFGKNIAGKYDRLALKLFNMFETPLLRAHFVFKKEWILHRIVPISMSEIPASHHEFLMERAHQYFKQKYIPVKKIKNYKYDIAILHDPKEKNPPSDEIAIRKFMRAAERRGLHPELVTKDDYARIAEYDALFIRTTTAVNHYTYQFARRGEAENLAVIDDTQSIIRCTNKIYLAEVLERAKVATPRTHIVHHSQIDSVLPKISYPCIVKLPDSAFSMGVKKAANEDEFKALAALFFEESDLILVQEFIATEYDWRIGIIDGKILYACKYHMAGSHWQILNHTKSGRVLSGNVEAVALSRVPAIVKEEALRAAQLIGHGLYGVDMKLGPKDKPYIIEINDNPSIEAGYEDQLLKDKLYDQIMASFLKRIEKLRRS